MGFGGRRKKKRGQGDAAANAEKRPKLAGEFQHDSFGPAIVKDNAAFVAYYKAQGIVPDAEWDAFMEALRAPLPSSFRICEAGGNSHEILRRLTTEFSVAGADEKKEETDQRPTRVAWYPRNMAWQSLAGRKELRKIPHLAAYHRFIVTEHEKGNLNRQEVVSMIPALLLDVQPEHAVLDMCAAPGSKTAQLLEAIQSANPFASGVVVANDVDFQRAYLLVHQTKRLGSPQFAVSMHEGQFFPTIYKRALPATDAPAAAAASSSSSSASSSSTTSPPSSENAQMWEYYDSGALEVMRFDRILADVPCSGDGTFRKSIDLWKKWNTTFGASLHKLQLDIARRAVQMLKVGGIMVYSTCSLNPLEDEAVVADLLRRFPGVLELVDASAQLPGLVREPGVSQWLVPSLHRDERTYRTLADVDAETRHPKLRDSFFAPSADEAALFHLERCMRVLPHKQDTGGFFIAVLHKTADIPKSQQSAASASSAAATAVVDAVDAVADFDADAEPTPAELDVTGDVPIDPQTLRGGRGPARSSNKHPDNKANARGGGQKGGDGDDDDEEEDAMRPIAVLNSKNCQQIREFFGVKTELPDHNLFVRSEAQRKIYFVNNDVGAILRARHHNARFKLAHCGLKIFQAIFKKQSGSPEYRVCQEGLHVVLPFLTKQVVYANEADFVALIEKPQTFTKAFSDPEFIAQIERQALGCVIVVLKPEALAAGDTAARVASASRPVAVSAWRTPVMLNCMVTKIERQSILQLLRPDAQLDAMGDAKFQMFQRSRLEALKASCEARAAEAAASGPASGATGVASASAPAGDDEEDDDEEDEDDDEHDSASAAANME